MSKRKNWLSWWDALVEPPETVNGVFSKRQPGRLPGNFSNRYSWVQILAPECQEPVQMKHLESIQRKLKIQMEPIESIQMEPIE